MTVRTPLELVLPRLAGLKRNGDGYLARCPAHDDTSQSLSLHEGDDGRLLLMCFTGCTVEAIVAALDLEMRDLFVSRNGRSGSTVRTIYRREIPTPSPTRTEVGVEGGGHIPPPIRIEHSNPDADEVESGASHDANGVREEVDDRFEHSNRSSAGEGGVSTAPDSNRTVEPGGLTLEAYAEAKKLPLGFVQGLGLRTINYVGSPAVRIPYRDPDGTEGAVRFRRALAKGEHGDQRFAWKSGTKVRLYGLERLEEARRAGFVILVEGESDCHTAWHHGLPAIGVAGANNWNERRDAHHLDDVPVIYAVIEPDGGGEALEKKLAVSDIRRRLRLVNLGALKDLSGLHLADPVGFLVAWERAAAGAVVWFEREKEAQAAAARALERSASALLDAPDLFDRLGTLIAGRGYAGDPAPVVRVYVAMTSRLLERPVNVAVVAASASGKNRTVDAAAELIPPEALYVEKAGSARALVYTEDSFEHRVVIVAEADSIPDEGPAASAVRSIAEDNEMRYDVVERDEGTSRFVVRRIVKAGPTALVTTSTKSVQHQLGTRMLEMPVPDDERQTRAVLHAHAAAVRRAEGPLADIAPWLALQRFLAASGVTRVEVPFGGALAARVPAKAVRMRRDFRQLLTFVQAVALLRVRHRDAIDEGWIVATIEDYAVARELLAPIFETIAAEGCTPAVRETVGKVKHDEEVTGAQIAERLGLSRSTVSWRIARAIEGGWLVNKETRRGQPQRLTVGVPLPAADSALPSVDDVQSAWTADLAPDWVEDRLAEEEELEHA